MRKLHYAARAGHVGAVKRLLAAAQADARTDGTPRTALDLARERGHAQVVRLLSR